MAEQRIPSGGKSFFGVNLPQLAFYQPGSGYLVDAMKSAESHWRSGGYVIGDVPLNGSVMVAFDGTGTVNGKRAGDVMAVGKLLKVNAQGDVRNLSLRREAGGNATFTAACLNSLDPAGVLRTMDWLRTNNSPVVKWADRCKLEDQVWSGPNGGPFEPVLQLAVAEGKDVWLNVPHQADDDYVRQLALLCKSIIGTAPVNLYLEDSNEVWNGQFAAWKWQSARGGQKWHADRTLFIGRTFREVFGASDRRIRPVLGCGLAQYTVAIEAFNRLGASVSELYGLAIAPYFGSSLPAEHTGWTPQQYADHALNTANYFYAGAGGTVGAVRKYKALANVHKIKMLAYEGGLDFNQGDANVANKAASQLLPTTGEAVEKYLEWWRAEGGDVFCYFNQISLWNRSGMWGLESLPAQRGPKWDAWARVAGRHMQDVVEQTPTPTPPIQQPRKATKGQTVGIGGKVIHAFTAGETVFGFPGGKKLAYVVASSATPSTGKPDRLDVMVGDVVTVNGVESFKFTTPGEVTLFLPGDDVVFTVKEDPKAPLRAELKAIDARLAVIAPIVKEDAELRARRASIMEQLGE